MVKYGTSKIASTPIQTKELPQFAVAQANMIILQIRKGKSERQVAFFLISQAKKAKTKSLVITTLKITFSLHAMPMPKTKALAYVYQVCLTSDYKLVEVEK